MSIPLNQRKQTIPEFYNGKTIFITGGSGFIGKVLIEKLLRSCPDIKNIYVLIRPKKNKTIQERIRAMFDIPLFDKLKSENIKAIDKVLGIQGDVSQLNLGLSEDDTKTLVETVSIIFHNAASVRFDDFLKSAILINTRSTRDVIVLAKQMKFLEAFIHVSTAYSHADHEVIEEKIYPPKQDWREAIELAENYDEESLQVLSLKYIHPMPNTYTFTKALAERVVFDLCENQLPAAIMRPSIVAPTISEPMTGWVDNFNGPIALNIIGVKGLLRVLLGDPNAALDNVFVDNVVKGLIIAAWEKSMMVNPLSTGIYNLAKEYVIPLGHFSVMGRIVAAINPSDSYLMPMTDIVIVRNPTYFYFLTLLLHVLPGLILDALTLISGNKPRILKIYRKTYIASISLVKFNIVSFDIRYDSYEALQKLLMDSDRSDFSYFPSRFSVHSKIAHQKSLEMWYGVKKYLLKENPLANEVGVRKYARSQKEGQTSSKELNQPSLASWSKVDPAVSISNGAVKWESVSERLVLLKILQSIVYNAVKGVVCWLILSKLILPGISFLIYEVVTENDS